MQAAQDLTQEAQGLTSTSQTFNLALQLRDLSLLCSRSALSLALLSTMLKAASVMVPMLATDEVAAASIGVVKALESTPLQTICSLPIYSDAQPAIATGCLGANADIPMMNITIIWYRAACRNPLISQPLTHIARLEQVWLAFHLQLDSSLHQR